MADGLCMEGTVVRTTNNVISKDELKNTIIVVDNENINKSIDNKLSVDVKCKVNTSDSCGVDEEKASSSSFPCASSSVVINNSSSLSSNNFYIDSDSGKLCSSKFNNNDSSGVVVNNNNNIDDDKGVVPIVGLKDTNRTCREASVGNKLERVPQVSPVENSDKVSQSSCHIIASGGGANQEVVVQCSDPHSPCSSADHEDCRKKRCADRYDSSESSDSGVAQLSCTDCSACSSSSTASSDITDPGSPFSTTSSHGEDSSPAPTPSTGGGIQTMPPRQDTTVSCWSSSDPPTTAKQFWPWNKTEKHEKSVNKPNRETDITTKDIPNKQTSYTTQSTLSARTSQSLKRAPSIKPTHSKISPKRLKTATEEIVSSRSPSLSSQISFLAVAPLQNAKPVIPQLAPVTSPAQNLHPPILLESKHDVAPAVYKTPARLLKSPSSLVKTSTISCHVLPKSQSSSEISVNNTLAIANTNLIQANAASAALKGRTSEKSLPKDTAKNNNTLTCKARTLPHLNIAQNLQKNPQGKITEYFKEQIKTPICVKKELNGSGTNSKTQLESIRMDSGTKKKKGHYLGLISGNMGRKLVVNGKCDSIRSSDFYRKIDVRTLTMPSQLKNVTETKINKRLSPVVSLTRKILPKPPPNQQKCTLTSQSTSLNPSVKLTALRFPQEINSVAANVSQPLENVLVSNANNFHGAVKLVNPVPIQKRSPPLIIPTSLNTALPTVVTPKVSSMQVFAPSYTNCPPLVKLNGTFIPIVKLNSLPVKLNGTSVNPHQPPSIPSNVNTNAALIEAGVPTVPIVKQKVIPAPATVTAFNENCLKTSTATLNTQAKSLASSKNSSLETIQQKKSKLDVECTELQKSAVDPTEKKDTSVISVNEDTSVKKSDDLLHISVASTPPLSVESQKSPILSQPKTIRFPPREINHEDKEHRRSDSRDSGLCRWSECKAQFETSGALLEHLQIAHVISQATKENYVCLWIGCKVHGRTSCSRSWLERHVLSHAGNKPYRCIVDGCGCRFNSQTALERHVNSHFNSAEGTPTNGARKSLESSANKLLKRNGKKIRYRLQPWSARMFDFFDAGIMEGLQQKLVNITQQRTSGRVAESSGRTITLRSKILARRTGPDKSVQVLLHWYPEDVVPDEWIAELEAKPVKDVPIPGLEPSAIDVLHTTLLKKDVFGHNMPSPPRNERRKNKRKTSSSTLGLTAT